jgi:hypothetical protein
MDKELEQKFEEFMVSISEVYNGFYSKICPKAVREDGTYPEDSGIKTLKSLEKSYNKKKNQLIFKGNRKEIEAITHFMAPIVYEAVQRSGIGVEFHLNFLSKVFSILMKK